MSGYREFVYWSPTLGRKAARLSMVDSRGGEFFAVVPADDVALYRKRRAEALDAIELAIAVGEPPGEVEL